MSLVITFSFFNDNIGSSAAKYISLKKQKFEETSFVLRFSSFIARREILFLRARSIDAVLE